MCEQDGVDRLLYAIRFVINRLGRHDIKFVLLGGGASLDNLQRLNREFKLEQYVHFTGRVSDHDLCRYLSTADACVDPDPYTEWSDKSTMNKIMEYMTFAKPIVAYLQRIGFRPRTQLFMQRQTTCRVCCLDRCPD